MDLPPSQTPAPLTCSTTTSRLPQIFQTYQTKLQKIDALEQTLEQLVSEKRQRALNILEETPSHRHSHVRLFVTHTCEEDGSSYSNSMSSSTGGGGGGNAKEIRRNKWTLLIEGRLLVGHLDHESAVRIDQHLAAKHQAKFGVGERNESGSAATGSVSSGAAATTAGSGAASSSTTSAKSSTGASSGATAASASTKTNTNATPIPKPSTTQPSKAQTAIPLPSAPPLIHPHHQPPRLTDRNVNRSIYDREGEEPVTPIKFTHFFDRVSVSFQSFQRKVDEATSQSNMNAASGVGGGGGDSDGENVKGRKRSPRRNSPTPVSSMNSSSSTASSLPKKQYPYETNGRITDLICDCESKYSTSTTNTPNTNTHNSNESTEGHKRTHDTRAFQAIHIEGQEHYDEERCVVATIKLHRCNPRGEGIHQYIPSDALLEGLFPALGKIRKKKRKKMDLSGGKSTGTGSGVGNTSDGTVSASSATSSQVATSKLNDQPKATTSMDETTPEEVPRTIGPHYKTPPMDNDIYTPQLFTLEEIYDAIFLYAKERNLFQKKKTKKSKVKNPKHPLGTAGINTNSESEEETLGVIYNNATLQKLFDCSEMTLSTMRRSILSKGLLTPIVVGKVGQEAPLELTYVMRKDNATKVFVKTMGSRNSGSSSNDTTEKDSKLDTKEKGEEEVSEPALKKRRSSQPQPSTLKLLPNLLTCDIHVHVPHLLHCRTRDILRRIKLREYEYTSSRTKAIRMVQSSGADEDVVRERLEDSVKGRALMTSTSFSSAGGGVGRKSVMSGHSTVLLALAKAAPAGSEARWDAHIDARMGMLMDRLEHHSQMAKVYWGVVDACHCDK